VNIEIDNSCTKEDLSPASIRHEVEISLRNLKTDYIDLYQFHDPDPNTPIEESWEAMQTLIEEGKVRYGGLSNHTIELMERALTMPGCLDWKLTDQELQIIEKALDIFQHKEST